MVTSNTSDAAGHPPSSTRKMRRSREAQAHSSASTAANTDELLSGFDLYEVQGNAASALEVFKEETSSSASSASSTGSKGGAGGGGSEGAAMSSSARTYNQILLSHITQKDDKQQEEKAEKATTETTTHVDFIQKLEQFETDYKSNKRRHEYLSARKRKRNDLIMAYNRALVMHTHGQTQECIDLCCQHVADWIQNKIKPAPEFSTAAFRMTFLLLEALLSLSLSGRSPSSSLSILRKTDGEEMETDDENKKKNIPTLTEVCAWLDMGLEKDAKADPQLKFSLSLYKSRVDLAERSHGKHNEAKIRAARKELKVAMEIYQHKLRAAFGVVANYTNDTSSIVSSANSEEAAVSASSGGGGGGDLQLQVTTTAHQPQQPVGSIVLQRYNQSALNLKANLEQLKGNVTRSLILCSEANGATGTSTTDTTDNNDSSSYEAIHANNLGIVYATTHKRHLALHALAKGLTHAQEESRFSSDGTACPRPTLSILYNAAICALQAGNYLSAYECMATCVKQSTIFEQSPKCWLRMAEACLGVYHDEQSQSSPNSLKTFSAVEVNGEPRGLLFNRSCVAEEPLVAELASLEDMEQVERSPLLRARKSLECALARSDNDKNKEEEDDDDEEKEEGDDESSTVLATCLSLAYVCLAFRDYPRALELSTRVLDCPTPPNSSSSSDAENDDSVAARVHKRGVATARMYAAEASCAMGETMQAMKFLVGDGQDDAFDRLASDLGGVTIETAASNGKGKRRLARAQTMVRSSASAATAAMGNLTAAKQLAMSAQAMEDAYESNRERSSARRALIYCLLRGDNHSAALSLLQSMRSK